MDINRTQAGDADFAIFLILVSCLDRKSYSSWPMAAASIRQSLYLYYLYHPHRRMP